MTLLLTLAAPAQTANFATAPNEIPLVVKGLRTDAAHAYNRMTISLTLCVPGASLADSGQCAQIDNVMLDTGSVGLRLQARAVAGLRLPQERSNGHDVAECFRFVGHNNIWGTLRIADLHLGDEVAASIPVHVADPDLPRPPDGSCPNYDSQASSNGTLGIGRVAQERSGTLYGCIEGDCRRLPVSEANGLRLPNPISRLPRDNDGEIFVIPPTDGSVAHSIAGLLILGVNTEPDNLISPNAAIVPLDPSGLFATQFDGKVFRKSYIDSGTQSISFKHGALSPCANAPGDYCTDTGGQFTANLLPAGAAPVSSPFRIMRQPGLAGKLYDVYPDIVSRATDPDLFVWGMPFFIGKRTALVQQGQTPPNAKLSGPFYAFTFLPP